MAAKKKAKVQTLDQEVELGEITPADETVITTPRGGAVAIAVRAAETADSFRILITIRAGYDAKNIKFDFGNYGGGTVKGGGDGSEPCP